MSLLVVLAWPGVACYCLACGGRGLPAGWLSLIMSREALAGDERSAPRVLCGCEVGVPAAHGGPAL